MAIETPEKLWTAYLKAYGPISAEERKRLLTQSVADGVVFTNPAGEGTTRDGLITHIEGFQKQSPGAYFTTDKVYARRGELLAIWSMHKAGRTKVATGYNFVRFADDGRLEYMAGFF